MPAVGGTGSIKCTRPSLAQSAGNQVFTLVVQVSSTAALGTTISNTATVTSNPTDTDAANNTVTTTTTVGAQDGGGGLNPLFPNLPGFGTGSGSGSGQPIVITNNNSSSSTSNAAATAVGAAGAVATPPGGTPKELAKTGIEVLPMAALALALMAFGYLLLQAAPAPAPLRRR
jgi:hypothetical protein